MENRKSGTNRVGFQPPQITSALVISTGLIGAVFVFDFILTHAMEKAFAKDRRERF